MLYTPNTKTFIVGIGAYELHIMESQCMKCSDYRFLERSFEDVISNDIQSSKIECKKNPVRYHLSSNEQNSFFESEFKQEFPRKLILESGSIASYKNFSMRLVSRWSTLERKILKKRLNLQRQTFHYLLLEFVLINEIFRVPFLYTLT